jgi:hypothetical protein
MRLKQCRFQAEPAHPCDRDNRSQLLVDGSRMECRRGYRSSDDEVSAWWNALQLIAVIAVRLCNCCQLRGAIRRQPDARHHHCRHPYSRGRSTAGKPNDSRDGSAGDKLRRAPDHKCRRYSKEVQWPQSYPSVNPSAEGNGEAMSSFEFGLVNDHQVARRRNNSPPGTGGVAEGRGGRWSHSISIYHPVAARHPSCSRRGAVPQ